MAATTGPANNLRVFISSTFSDLQEHRQAVFDALQGLGVQGDNMVYWSADERSGATLSVDRVGACDALLLLVAHRYGHVPEGATASITEQEYLEARRREIPVLAFFLDERVAWPPDRIDFEHREQLHAFKRRVEADVTRQLFRSVDELGRQVTQAMASFIDRRREQLSSARRFGGPTLQVQASPALLEQPDTVVRIGTTETGLPLLLGVRRTHDLRPHLNALSRAVSASGAAPEALLETFRQALEAHGRQGWARERIRAVAWPDGSSRPLYVLKENLTELFRSCLALLLHAARTQRGNDDEPAPGSDRSGASDAASVIRTVIPAHEAPTTRGAPAALQSEGGTNRFLGIDPHTGEAFSVGRAGGHRWVVWRPFQFESLAPLQPAPRVRLDGRDAEPLPLAQLPAALLKLAIQSPGAAEPTWPTPRISVRHQAIAALLARCATRLLELHRAGTVHGDIKPDNILLLADGPELIDAFALAEGALSPGWTPSWSAPEQVLGEPVSTATDLVPFGRMISDLLGGELVGEVRKFKARLLNRSTREFDVFYNPHVHVAAGARGLGSEGLAAWTALARQCLRFAPSERPSAQELVDQLQRLLQSHPLHGEVQVAWPQRLGVATLLDGQEVVAAILGDEVQPVSPGLPAAPPKPPAAVDWPYEAERTWTRGSS